MTSKSVVFGVIGCGNWGPNHVRNLLGLGSAGADMRIAVDVDEARRRRIQSLFPSVAVAADAATVLDDPDVDAVVVATPAGTHYELASSALRSGKHVLVEKPMATSIKEGEDLHRLAADQGRVLMVGHTFEYTAAVNAIKNLVGSGDLGEILYVRSLRVNLGLYQKDINVMWDLAPHDLSIIHYALGARTTHVSAVGKAHMHAGVEDIVSLSLELDSGALATVIVSWLDPRKVREMTIVGTERMLVYDDTSPTEKIRLYDKGLAGPSEYTSFGEFAFSYRYGDITIPLIDDYEPLREQSRHFLECIRGNAKPRSDGESGLAVIRALAAGHLSLRDGGERVSTADPRVNDVEGIDG